MGKGKDRGRASGEEAFPEEQGRKYWAGAAVTKTQTLGEGAAAKWVPFGKEVKLRTLRGTKESLGTVLNWAAHWGSLSLNLEPCSHDLWGGEWE